MLESSDNRTVDSEPPPSSWKSGLLAGFVVFIIFSILIFIFIGLFVIPQEYYFLLLAIFACLPWSNKIAKSITGVDFEKQYLSKWVDNLIQ